MQRLTFYNLRGKSVVVAILNTCTVDDKSLKWILYKTWKYVKPRYQQWVV